MKRSLTRGLLLVGVPAAALALAVLAVLVGDTSRAAAADPKASAIGANLADFAGNLDQATVLDPLSAALPLQARDQVSQVLARANGFADAAATRLDTVANDASLTLASLDARLDDLDGDGNSASDVPLSGVTVDIQGSVSPQTTASTYTVTLSWKVTTAADGPVSLVADGVPVAGQPLVGSLTVTGQATFRYQPAVAAPKTFVLLNPAAPLAEVRASLSADFGDTDPAHGANASPLAVEVGVLGAAATGTADADVRIGMTVRDANSDGVVDSSELAAPATLFGVGCTGGEVHVALALKAAITGLEGTVGTVGLDDTNVCNGIPVPTVALGDLADFRQVSPTDMINGFAQLTTALASLQAGGDLDLPFVKQGLASVVSFNEKLVKFFVDNGLTDPGAPMAQIKVDPATLPTVDTLQEILPKLAAALGLPAGSLGLTYADHAVSFTFQTGADPGPKANAGQLDFGDQLGGVGLTGLQGTAQATVDAVYTLKLGLGIDLRPGLDITDRFFFKTGADAEITADAAVSADVDLTGKVALLAVTAKDSNSAGSVPLLQRKDATRPMLSVHLNGRGDDRLTLKEIATAVTTAQLPFAATVNAAVPSTTLTVASTIAGAAVAAGTVTVAWPDIAVPAGLAVTADTTFQRTVLPFAYDPTNPVASISQIMKAARDAVVGLRGLVAGNGTTVTDLPLVGRSAADLDPVLSQLQDKLDDIVSATSALTLDDARAALAHTIAQALGLPTSAESDLLTLEYQPATASTRAAVVAHLKVGICTTDRAGTGCSGTVARPSYPLNLQLGTGAEAVGLAGVTSSGTLAASFDALLSLDFGVELPTVVPGATGGNPTVSGGPPSPFVLDGSRFTLGVGVAGNGTLQATLGPATIELRAAQAKLAARFTLGLASPSGARIALGSGAFSSWLNSLVPTSLRDTVRPSGCASSADACASLPVYLNGTSLGTVTFTAPNLLAPGGWSLTGVENVLASVQASDIAFGMLADGLKTLVQRLSAALSAIPPGTTIPLLGVDITAGVDVVKGITDGVVTPAIDLANTLKTAGTAGNARSRIQQFFLTNVGPGSANKLLRDANNDGSVTAADVTVTLTCRSGSTTAACADATTLNNLVALEVRAPLGADVSGGTPAFDIGFPGFRLASKGSLSGHAGFVYNLAFGIDKERGFYIPTAGPLPELQVTAGAALPNVSGADNDLTGDIAFIPVTAEDQHTGDDVLVTAGIDITGGDGDGHLGLQQLGTVSLTPSLSVCANTSMKIATALDNVTGGGMPKLTGVLNIKGGYSCNGSIGAPNGTGFAIGFDDVSVDVGSFVSKFISPIAHDIRKVTGPLEPVVDAIRSPVPGVAEAAKLAGLPPPTWYGIFKTFNDVSGGGNGLEMIDRIITVVDVVRQLDAKPGGSGSIKIGSFGLNTAAASTPLPTDRLGELLGGQSLFDPRSILDRLGDNGISVPALSAILESRSAGGFSFPVWDNPSSLFGLLIGKDVTLAHFDAGKLEVSASFSAGFNIGPIVLTIGGGATVEGHFGIGYDTAGFRYAYKVLTDDDPTNNGVFDLGKGLIQGFYIDDLDSRGKDIPEIKFTGRLTVGAGVGIPGFNVRVEGGVNGEIGFDLKDPDKDGKVHFQEFVDQLAINPNPICLFTAGAKVGAFVQVVFQALFVSWTLPVADVVLYEQPDVLSFCQKPDPGLATKYADGTLALKTTDQPDQFVVDVTGAGAVTVSARGTSQQFTGITRVFADGGAGADQIVMISHSTSRIAAFFCGGPGSDRLSTTAGPAKLYGDDGPGITASGTTLSCTAAGSGGGDTLTGDKDADTLDGGPGNDVLVGGDGADTLVAGTGNDTLRGGYGNDSLQGGDGDDTSDYADHTGGVNATAGVGGGQIGTTEQDTAPGVESIIGTPSGDTLTGGNTGVTHLDGLGGNDTLVGGAASDFMLGGDGNDTLRPGAGANQAIGGNGDDTFVNGVGGSDVFLGDAGVDTADYSAATTPVTVSVDGAPDDGPREPLVIAGAASGTPTTPAADNVTNAETLIGGSAPDVLAGGNTADTLIGNGGGDDLMGGGGNDVMTGGDGDDRLEGSTGADDFQGGAGFDTADYANRTDGLVISVDDLGNDGAISDGRADNVRTDVEHVVGGSGADLVNGRVGLDDLVEAGPGDDTVVGNGGTDHLVGGTGNDNLQGGSGADLLEGGDGNDQLAGRGGDDTLLGQAGDNALDGGLGTDTLVGSGGRDTLRGGPGSDTLTGGDGNDVLYGDAPVARADDAADVVKGEGGNDRVYGGGGNDTVDGGTGNDTVTGEGGDDVLVAGGTGNDAVRGGDGKDTLDGGDGNDVMSGDAGNDVIRAGTGNDTLQGGPGDDVLQGSTGDDVLDGGDGNDSLDGGTNADQLTGGDGVDTATWASRTEPLDLAVDGVAADGGASDVRTVGGDGAADSLGSDVEKIVGGNGDDTLTVAQDGSYSLNGGGGNDTLLVASFVARPQTLLGGTGNDSLTGGSGADVLDGGTGDDTERGGAGDDRFAQGAAANGADTLVGGTGFDQVDYAARTTTVSVTFDNVANDGASGEKDNVGRDVENALQP